MRKQNVRNMNVLSLFDGMSCGRVALQRCGFKINKYYASEIDKYAITVAANNYLDTIHIGDVTKVRAEDLEPIDIVIGGTPCQGFSFAGKQLNFEDPRSKLFFEFVRLVKECKPKYFFLENVVMKKEFQDVISSYLGVEPIMLNSSLVSAQSRKRLYWTNIPGYTPPEDKGILLKDIVHEHTDFKPLSNKEIDYMLKSSGNWSPSTNNRFETYLNYPDGKNHCLTANLNKGVPYNCYFEETDRYILLEDKPGLKIPEATKKGFVEIFEGEGVDLTFIESKTRRGRRMADKCNCLTAASYDYRILEELKSYIVPFDKTLQILDKEVARGKVGYFRKDSQANRVYYIHDKAVTLCGDAGGGAAKMGQYLFGCITPDRVDKRQNGQRFNDGTKFYTLTAQDRHGILIEGYIRKLTPIECERLQTLPDNYTAGVSNSQRYKMLGNGWTVDAVCEFFKHLPFEKNNINSNHIIMNKLSKSKSFSVSNETVEVNFKGNVCECANLLKSGITNQTIVLVAYNSVWHEINVLNLGGDDSNLQSFKNFIETMNLSLVDLGIAKEEIKTDYTLKHQDFLDLQSEFPAFDYIQISKLNDSNAKIHLPQSVYELRQWLNMCVRDNISIETLIAKRDLKQNDMTEKTTPEKQTIDLEIQDNVQTAIPVEKIEVIDVDIIHTARSGKRMCNLSEMGLVQNTEGDGFNGFGYFVSKESIISDSEEDWVILINKITQEKTKNKVTPSITAEVIQTGTTTTISETVAEKPAKKPISIQVFETLTPERISELQGLKERQQEIIKANPVVKKITDKTSYELAKKTAAVLLKASTAIDGKEGIEATATKYLNTFKTMLQNAFKPIAKLTRDLYDEQKGIISAWENAELLREQKEQREKLEKIKKRTDELFAVPFTFNGTIYSIGTVYCVPSQIESATDEEFKVIVDNGKVIKQALDAEALKNAEKDKEIEELRKKLAALEGLQNISNIEEATQTGQPVQASIQQPIPPTDKVSDFMNPNHVPGNVTQKTAATGPTTTGPAYTLPSIENIILNKLDLENAEHLEKPAYIKCRSYFVRGSKDLAKEIQFILNDTAPNTLKKSERIDNLCNVVLNS